MDGAIRISRKWKKAELYSLYWIGYLPLFTLIEGSTNHDFIQVFRNELISLPPKIIFVGLVVETFFMKPLGRSRLATAITVYVLLILTFAFLMRMVDNYIILHYFLTHWAKEPLLSAAPFLYNIIKLQFLLTIPFCIRLYQYFTAAGNRQPAALAEHDVFEKNALLVKCERRMQKLLFDDIEYFEAQGNYLEICTVKGTFKTYLSISELEEMLPSSKFARIHRSFVIALNKVEDHNHRQVTIGNM